jgi:hypothetical protein
VTILNTIAPSRATYNYGNPTVAADLRRVLERGSPKRLGDGANDANGVDRRCRWLRCPRAAFAQLWPRPHRAAPGLWLIPDNTNQLLPPELIV